MSYDNTNKGILGRNDRREKDTHPEYTGSINVDGKDYWLSAWVKDRNDGSGKFFSLSVKPKEAKGGGQQQRNNNNNQRSAPPPAGNSSLDDDDIPF